jgi:hypothetical protein
LFVSSPGTTDTKKARFPLGPIPNFLYFVLNNIFGPPRFWSWSCDTERRTLCRIGVSFCA